MPHDDFEVACWRPLNSEGGHKIRSSARSFDVLFRIAAKRWLSVQKSPAPAIIAMSSNVSSELPLSTSLKLRPVFQAIPFYTRWSDDLVRMAGGDRTEAAGDITLWNKLRDGYAEGWGEPEENKE